MTSMLMVIFKPTLIPVFWKIEKESSIVSDFVFQNVSCQKILCRHNRVVLAFSIKVCLLQNS